MKKTIYAILACIIIAGIAITIFMGLNFDLKFTANKQLDINIGKKFNNNDIKQIVREVLEDENAEVIVQKVEIYEDMASIIVPQMTDEQVEKLNTKLNEKYEIENKIEDIQIENNSNVRGRDLVTPYIWPVAVSMAIVLIYACIMYRRLGIVKVIIKIVGVSVIAELVYLGLIAITRIPVTTLIVPIALVVYVATLIITILNLDKTNKEILEKKSK